MMCAAQHYRFCTGSSISLWWNWWAGVSYGPRIWSDMLPYLAYFVIPAWRRCRGLPA